MLANRLEEIRVLIVEGEELDRELIETTLEKCHGTRFETHSATTLQEATEILDSGTFEAELVILDLALPDSIGIPTFQTLREKFPLLPMVIVTGRDNEETALSATAAGVQEFLTKSALDESLLVRTARYAIERARVIESIDIGLERAGRDRELRRLRTISPPGREFEGLEFTNRYIREIEIFFADEAGSKKQIDGLVEEMFLGGVSGTDVVRAHLDALEHITSDSKCLPRRSVDQGRVFLLGLLAGLANRYRSRALTLEADPR